MKTTIPFFLVLVLMIFSSCREEAIDTNENREIQLDEKSAQLVEADNAFGLELFQNVTTAETEAENIMISPLSVSLALAMTYNGADGETKTAMEETLKVHGLTTDEINSSYQTLVNALKSLDEKVILEIADAIFYRQDFTVEDDFITVNQQYYDAEVSPLDFNSSDALETINNWVADKTNDKITSIINNIPGEAVMFLLNAIYFNGIWQKEFNEESTQEQSFYLVDNSTVSVEMMSKVDTVEYTSNDLFSAIKLPYGGGNYNMLVFLPESDKTTGDIIERLDTDNWENWMDSFEATQGVQIQLPKFKFEYGIELNNILSEMGMEITFSSDADFTGINKDGGLYIGFVKHKSFIDVNEEGTEAAAVTVVGIYNTVSDENKNNYIPFYVNKPFLFAITEKDTGAILFIGEVNHPEYE